MFIRTCKRLFALLGNRAGLLAGVLSLLFSLTLTAYAALTVSNSGLSGDAGVTVDGAGALNLGTASSTSIVLGRTGKPVTIQGSSLNVSGTSTVANLLVTGNVGIGTSTPAYPLTVVGDAGITGNVTIGSETGLPPSLVGDAAGLVTVATAVPNQDNIGLGVETSGTGFVGIYSALAETGNGSSDAIVAEPHLTGTGGTVTGVYIDPVVEAGASGSEYNGVWVYPTVVDGTLALANAIYVSQQGALQLTPTIFGLMNKASFALRLTTPSMVSTRRSPRSTIPNSPSTHRVPQTTSESSSASGTATLRRSAPRTVAPVHHGHWLSLLPPPPV